VTKRFVSIGECMVEMAPQPDGTYAMGFAGDTFNTAWYARTCLTEGWRVDYLTAVGRDAVSDRMVAFMGAAGIDTGHIARLEGRTVGLYLIELQGAERSFSYWRGASAARALADDPARLEAALSGADVAYFSGITLAILEPEARLRLAQSLTRARHAGTIVAFDPNLRPKLWPSEQAMCSAVTQAAGLADIVLPSFEDEARHFGDTDPMATVTRYQAAGAKVVVVKDGAGEVLCADGAALTRHNPAPVLQVVDTTAAGDSFNAGFLAAWMAGQGALAAMAAGSALAGRVIGARGALIGL
jgi:2-dehydro-3-deoxygluconokinase